MYDSLKYQVIKSAAVITLNRPKTLNALTYLMIDELKHALTTADHDPSVVGVVITGEGKGFCSGMDMSTLESTSATGELVAAADKSVSDADADSDATDEESGSGYAYFMKLRKPVIAAINGAAAGMGMSISLFCDLRFAASNAVFVTSFSQRGLIAEHGQCWLLPRLIGPAHALDLLWSSRKVTAEEALDIGLVDRIFNPQELVDATVEYIEHLATHCSPLSIMRMKRQVYNHMPLTLEEAMIASDELMAESIKDPDYKEGVASFTERRLPKFARIGNLSE